MTVIPRLVKGGCESGKCAVIVVTVSGLPPYLVDISGNKAVARDEPAAYPSFRVIFIIDPGLTLLGRVKVVYIILPQPSGLGLLIYCDLT